MNKKKSLGRRIWENRNAYLFLLPVFLFLFVFKYATFFTAVVESFFNWNGANVNEFVGFDNFIQLCSDSAFGQSMVNITIMTMCNVVIALTFPLGAAMLVYSCKNQRISNFFKVLYIVPMVVPSLVVYLMWKWIYAYDTGAINQFLRAAGLEGLAHSWLGESGTALAAIILIGFPFVGAFGLQFLVYLGGLLNISIEIMESATLDGIRPLQKVRCIWLPMLKPQLKMFLMLAIIDSMQLFENVLVLTDGGPGRSTIVPALYMYRQAFTYNRMGYASAIGVVLFLIVLFFTVINYKYVNTEE